MESIEPHHSHPQNTQEVNTARICTRVPTAFSADPSVPNRSPGSPSAAQNTIYREEHCATTSREVPWSLGDDPNARFGEPGWRATHSVGGIPFYTRGSTPTYPPVSSWGALGIGSRQETIEDNGFGDKCTHSPLPLPCTSDTDCHTSYRCHQVGRVCVRRNSLSCGLTEADPCWCYIHEDCSASQMCSGTGR